MRIGPDKAYQVARSTNISFQNKYSNKIYIIRESI